jgi:hypothetical protein
MPESTTREEEPRVAARLLESGVELIRAEIAQAVERARTLSVQMLTAVLATILAAAFAQVALVLTLLYPILTRRVSSSHVLMGLALPVGLAVASSIVGVFAWGDVRRSKRALRPSHPTHAGAATTQPRAIPARQTSPLPKE